MGWGYFNKRAIQMVNHPAKISYTSNKTQKGIKYN